LILSIKALLLFKRERRNSQRVTREKTKLSGFSKAATLLDNLDRDIEQARFKTPPDHRDRRRMNVHDFQVVFDKYLKILRNQTIDTNVAFVELLDARYIPWFARSLESVNLIHRRWLSDEYVEWEEINFNVKNALDLKLSFFVHNQSEDSHADDYVPNRYGLSIRLLFNQRKCLKLKGLACWKTLPYVEHLYDDGIKKMSFFGKLCEYCPVSMIGVKTMLSNQLTLDSQYRVGRYIYDNTITIDNSPTLYANVQSVQEEEIGGLNLDPTNTFVKYGVDMWWILAQRVLNGECDLGIITHEWKARLISGTHTMNSRIEMTAIIPTTDGWCWLCHDLFFGITNNASTIGVKPTKILGQMQPSRKYMTAITHQGLEVNVIFESRFTKGHVDIKVTCTADMYMLGEPTQLGEICVSPSQNIKVKPVLDANYACTVNTWNTNEPRRFRFLLTQQVNMTVAGKEVERDEEYSIFYSVESDHEVDLDKTSKVVPKKTKTNHIHLLGVTIDPEETNEKKKNFKKAFNKRRAGNPKSSIKKIINNGVQRYAQSKCDVQKASIMFNNKPQVAFKNSDKNKSKQVMNVKTIPGAPEFKEKKQLIEKSIFEEYAANFIDDEGNDLLKGSEFKAYHKKAQPLIVHPQKSKSTNFRHNDVSNKLQKKKPVKKVKKEVKAFVATVLSNKSEISYQPLPELISKEEEKLETKVFTNHQNKQKKTKYLKPTQKLRRKESVSDVSINVRDRYLKPTPKLLRKLDVSSGSMYKIPAYKMNGTGKPPLNASMTSQEKRDLRVKCIKPTDKLIKKLDVSDVTIYDKERVIQPTRKLRRKRDVSQVTIDDEFPELVEEPQAGCDNDDEEDIVGDVDNVEDEILDEEEEEQDLVEYKHTSLVHHSRHRVDTISNPDLRPSKDKCVIKNRSHNTLLLDDLSIDDSFEIDIMKLHQNMPETESKVDNEKVLWYAIHTKFTCMRPSLANFKELIRKGISISSWIELLKGYTFSTLKNWYYYFTSILSLGYNWVKRVWDSLKKLVTQALSKVGSWTNKINNTIKTNIKYLKKDVFVADDSSFDRYSTFKTNLDKESEEVVAGKLQLSSAEESFIFDVESLQKQMPEVEKKISSEEKLWYSIHTKLMNITPNSAHFKTIKNKILDVKSWCQVLNKLSYNVLKDWLSYFSKLISYGYNWIQYIISTIKNLLKKALAEVDSWRDRMNQLLRIGIKNFKQSHFAIEEEDEDMYSKYEASLDLDSNEEIGGRVRQTAEINGFGLVGHKIIPMTIGEDPNSHSIMDKNGIDYCVSANTTRHGGHVGLRVLSDAMQLACIINAKCQRLADPNTPYVIIDHGSKFSRVLPLLTPMVQPHDTLIMARPLLNQADIAYWFNHERQEVEGLRVEYSYGTFEALNDEYSEVRVIHLIHDVHYYLNNFTAHPGHSYYFSGIDFSGEMGNNDMVGVDYNIKNAIDYKLSFVTDERDYVMSDVCIEFHPNSNSKYKHRLQNITSLNRGMQLKEVIYDEHITFRALVIHGVNIGAGGIRRGIPIRWKHYRNHSTPTDYLDVMTKNVLKLTGVMTDKKSTIRILQAKHDDPTSIVSLASQVVSNCKVQEIEKKFYYTTNMVAYLEGFDVYRHVHKSLGLFGIYDFVQDFNFELDDYPNLLASLKSLDYYIGGVNAYSLRRIGGNRRIIIRIALSAISGLLGVSFYQLSFNISVLLMLFIYLACHYIKQLYIAANGIREIGCYKYAIFLIPLYGLCMYIAWNINVLICIFIMTFISLYWMSNIYFSLPINEKSNVLNYRSCLDIFVYAFFIQFMVQTIPIVIIDGFLSDHIGGSSYSDYIISWIHFMVNKRNSLYNSISYLTEWLHSTMEIGGYSFISREWKLKDFEGNSNLVSSWWGISKGYMWATSKNDIPKAAPEPIQTGIPVQIGGYDVELYENIADSKSTFTAIFRRQLLTHLVPSEKMVEEFQEYITSDIEKIVNFVISKAIPVDIIKTINQTPGWGSAKKRKYIKHSFMALTNNKMCRSKMYYTAMVKTGEKYVSSRMVNWRHNSDRSRLIFVPESPAYTGLLTVVQRNVLKIVRDYMAGFSHGDSPESLKARIAHGISKIVRAISMSMDGSNHDGHQHISLIRAVDVRFWEDLFTDEFLDKIFKKYNIRATNEEIRAIFELSTHEETATLVVKRNNKKSWALQIKGTTFSGSATRTTFGNTLRVLFYFHFYLMKLGIPSNLFEPNEDSFILVSGDDVVLWLDEKWVNTFETGIYNLVSKEKRGKIGLGQCVEAVHKGCWHSFDFCSKTSGVIDHQWILSRDISKMLASSGWSRDGCRNITIEDHRSAVKDMLLHESFGLAVESWASKLDVEAKGRELLHYYPMDVKFNPSGVSQRAIYAEWARMAKLTEKESIELLISLEMYGVISLPEHYHLRPMILEDKPRMAQPTCTLDCIWCTKSRLDSLRETVNTPQGLLEPWLYSAYVAGSESVCLTHEAELKIKTGTKRINMNSIKTNSNTNNNRKNFSKKNRKEAKKNNNHAKKKGRRGVAFELNSKQILNAVDYNKGPMLESSSKSKPVILNNNMERGRTTFSRQGVRKSRVLTSTEEGKTRELFSELETARLHFNTARQFPGYPTPYVDGNTVYPLPTSVIETCFSRTAGSVSPIETGYSTYTYGVRDYTVIYLTPSITAMVKTGTSKYSGLNTEVVQSPTVSPALSSLAWNSTTMNDTWGTNLDTVGQRGFIFSASATIRIEAPSATLSGTVYLGSFPAHSAHNAGTISVNDLMRAATRTQSCEEPIVLVNSVMDTGLIRFDSTNVVPVTDLEEHIASEMVAYAVIEKGAVSITGGANAEYSLSFELVGNTVWWPQFIDVQSMAVARSGQVSVAPMRKDSLLQNITSVNDRTPSHSLYSKAKEFLVSQATAENLKKAWKFVKTTGVLKMLPFGIGAAAEFLKPPPIHCTYEERDEIEDLVRWLSRLPIPEEITDVGNMYYKECNAYRDWYYDFKCCLQKELENGFNSCAIKPIPIENDSKSDWRIAGDDSVLYKRAAR
jgi:hypothetical protein